MPYKFAVMEGKANMSVGFVHATDADEGINALVTYSIPNNVPFIINPESGEIMTKIALDYETQRVSIINLTKQTIYFFGTRSISKEWDRGSGSGVHQNCKAAEPTKC